ncbi:MAG: imidazole glycerol phosphate synthase subunit HisH [Candidatus Omnitrophica bacterium]|nr:imidazole glycerol phosphate synthase subunit HisH [Candidatus Omnitrophota bacterium]
MIAIIDYGMGNIHSVNKALEFYGAKTIITNKPGKIKECEKVVLPGVGAFDDAVTELEKQGLIPALKEHIKNKKIFLGICLGMQLLFEESREAKIKKGTGILKGGVEKFRNSKELKVPHIGWNQLNKTSDNCPLLKDIPDNAYVYFCHSYYSKPKDDSIVAATCNYGSDFTAVVWQDNIYGMQFHPEKSQDIGLKMLENFVNLKC